MIYLKNLEIKNFGGIAQFDYEFDPKVNIIESAYGTGKSSIKNAIYWVNDFSVDFVPSINNKKVIGLETSVKCTYNKNGTEYTFERTAKQAYKPKQGEIDIKVFDKYNYEYLFNGAALKSGEYEKRLLLFFEAEDKEELQVLFDFEFFNTDNGSKWDKNKRQQYLFKLFDFENKKAEMTKKYDLIADDILISKLSDDEIKNNLKRQSDNIKETQAKNNILIESKNKERAELVTIDFDTLKAKENALEKEIAKMQSEKIDTTIAETINQKHAQLSDIENQISEIDQAYQKNMRTYDLSVNNLKYTIEKLENEKKICEQKIKKIDSDIEDYDIDINNIESQIYDEKNNICPACKQALPQDKIDSLKTTFDANKAEHLQELRFKTEKSTLERQNTQARTNTLNGTIVSETANLNDLMANTPQKQDTESLTKNIEKLQAEINDLRVKTNNTDLENIIAEKQKAHKELIAEMAKEKTIDRLEKEILELKKSNRDLANQDNERLRKLVQFNEYKKRKNGMVNTEINNNFKGVNFNFVEQQGGGSQFGEKETCECQMGGVAYSNLSGGQQVLANFLTNLSLRKIKKINMPQFTDEICRITNNLEEIKELFMIGEQDWQTIYFVTQSHKKLPITLIKDMYTDKDCELSEA